MEKKKKIVRLRKVGASRSWEGGVGKQRGTRQIKKVGEENKDVRFMRMNIRMCE
jgi:hypothetical protein